jgi:hypothetical protein
MIWHGPPPPELFNQNRRRHTECVARDLRHRPIRHCIAAHKEGNPNDAVVTHQAHLGGRAVGHGIEQRDNAGRREIEAIHPFARFVDDSAERKGDRLQMGQETIKHLIREGGEQTVFNRTSRYG